MTDETFAVGDVVFLKSDRIGAIGMTIDTISNAATGGKQANCVWRSKDTKQAKMEGLYSTHLLTKEDPNQMPMGGFAE